MYPPFKAPGAGGGNVIAPALLRQIMGLDVGATSGTERPPGWHPIGPLPPVRVPPQPIIDPIYPQPWDSPRFPNIMTDSPQTPTVLPQQTGSLFNPAGAASVTPPAGMFDANGNYIGPPLTPPSSFLGSLLKRPPIGPPPIGPTLGG